jgi:hypothetical protein
VSAHTWCGRRLFGFDLLEWLMLLVAIAMLGAFVPWIETLPPGSSFAYNTYDYPCGDILVENASCTKFLLKDTLSSESPAQVNHEARH